MAAVTLDTSVLVDYLLFQMAERLGLDGLRDDITEPDATASLFEDGTQQLVIGGKVDDEFDALCDRHDAVYDDMLDWVTRNPGTALVEYDPSNRSVQTTDNDNGVLRIQIGQQLNGLSTPEQLAQFRRIRQAVQTIERERFASDSTGSTTSSTIPVSKPNSRDLVSITTLPSWSTPSESPTTTGLICSSPSTTASPTTSRS